MTIQNIAIIYNPKSSGQSPRMAQELYAGIRRHLPDVGVEVMPTKYAGHAADLAEIVGQTRPDAVILSVGGDGTYHEVVNGAMRLVPKYRPTCVVVPGGNANDHHRALEIERDIIERIKHPHPKYFEVLRMGVMNPIGQDIVRYAHSYVGFGMSGRVAEALNRESKGALSEKFIVLREIMQPRHFEILENRRIKHLHNLLCTNVSVMAKYLTVGPNEKVDDGKFTVTETPALSRMQLLKQVALSTAGTVPPGAATTKHFFMLMTPVQCQLDGETIWLPGGCSVTIALEPKAIATLG